MMNFNCSEKYAQNFLLGRNTFKNNSVSVSLVLPLFFKYLDWCLLSHFQFSPKSGPVAGNTILAINGSELGSKLQDVTEVSIGGLPCHVIEYVVAER